MAIDHTALMKLVEKADAGGKLTPEEVRAVAKGYLHTAVAAVEMNRVIKKLEEKAEAGSPKEREIYELAIDAYREVAERDMKASQEFHRVVLDAPGGAELIKSQAILPDQGRINDFINKTERQVQQIAREGLASSPAEDARSEPRGAQEKRRKRSPDNNDHSGSKKRGRHKASMEGAEDAAVVLAQFDSGDDDKGPGVPKMKSADKGLVVG